MEMTAEEARTFVDQGYVVLRDAVPRPLVDTAVRAINHSLGSQGMHPDHLTQFGARSYCPELQASSAIVDLLMGSPLWEYVQSAIGRGKVRPARGGQIALRFPRLDPPGPPRAHIDGMYSPNNGVQKGTIANFTALVGVLLSDLHGPFAGNFAVWPGTHRTFESYFRERGPQALLDGMPDVPMPEPLHITGRAGDAVFVHYQLAHTAVGNASPHVRYAIFFRLSHVDHDTVHWECMTDIWREWEGIREAVRERHPERYPAPA